MSAWSASSRPPPSYDRQRKIVWGSVSTYRVATDSGDDGLVEFGNDIPVGDEVGRVGFLDWKGVLYERGAEGGESRTLHVLSFISLMSAPAGL